MQAIILAGGFGTRLQAAVPGVPKPMAHVAGQPFLALLLEHLASRGICDVMLCVHHGGAQIIEYFGESYAGMRVRHAIEEEPLGTGGALRHGLQWLDPSGPVFALNGDSFIDMDFAAMMEHHRRRGRAATLAVRQMPDCRRYSTLAMRGGLVTEFTRLGGPQPGMASVGAYVIEPSLFDGFELPHAFSLESEFWAVHSPVLQPAVYEMDGYFIDIGVPDDYARACREIPALSPEAALA